MTTPAETLPTDLAAAHAMILAQREMLTQARSELTVGRLEIERLKLLLAKARREQFGQSSERGKHLIEQLELAIEDLEETQAAAETEAEMAVPAAAKEKRPRSPRPQRRPLPENLPVERIVEPAPCACGKCGGLRLRKLGEVVSKTLECEPRRWKIIEHVREKFSCRDCEAIHEPNKSQGTTPALLSNRSTCLIADFANNPRAFARACPIKETASAAPVITPSVPLAKDRMRLACKSWMSTRLTKS